jgi:hypothetical protein
MILNIHPGLLVDEDRWGVYVQDNLMVTPQGGRPLGDDKYEWHVLSAQHCVECNIDSEEGRF